jgi:hypothetical protein
MTIEKEHLDDVDVGLFVSLFTRKGMVRVEIDRERERFEEGILIT